jgi:acyl-CoA synthetase (AMP-forming)/AMP-acid ligase II/acyl carrier protein
MGHTDAPTTLGFCTHSTCDPGSGVSTVRRETRSVPRDLSETLSMRGRLQPDQRAFTFLRDGVTETSSLTRGELMTQARSIAARLRANHPPGSRVLLLFPSGTSFIAAFFGCLLAGCVAVPCPPPRRRQRTAYLRAVVEDCQPAIGLSLAEAIDDLAANGAELGDLPLSAVDLWTDNVPDAGGVSPAPDDLALLQYTSGSTGAPKGVKISHGNLLHNAEAIRRAMDFDRDSVLVSWLPCFHDFGLMTSVILPVHVGFHCVQMPPVAFVRRPAVWLRAIDSFRATHAGCPNFGFDLCVDRISHEERTGLDLSSWRVALSGAEPVRIATLRRFSDRFASAGFAAAGFSPCFGLAESTLFVTGSGAGEAPTFVDVLAEDLQEGHVRLAGPKTCPADGRALRTLVGCGRPPTDTTVKIVDPETRRELRGLTVGEIWVAGASVALGYWRNPAATEQAFGASLAGTGESRFLRTGDLGFCLHGELFVTGRIKDTIIVRGRTHYPQDIEETVERAHPALSPGRGVAFSVETDGAEHLIVAHEVRRDQSHLVVQDEIINKIRGALVRDHDLDPAGILLLAPRTLPRTSSGKIPRDACRAMFDAGHLPRLTAWLAPVRAGSDDGPQVNTARPPHHADEVATWLVNWIAMRRGLPREAVGLHIPFAEFGLDSIAAVELTQALETWLGRDVAVDATLAWTHPTIAHLSAHLAARPATGLSAQLLPHRSSHRSEVSRPLSVASSQPADPEHKELQKLGEPELIQLLLQELSGPTT